LSAEETRKMLLRDFQFDREDGKFSHVLASAKGKGGFWILTENRWNEKVGDPFIDAILATFVKMDYGSGMTYFKEIGIECGPCYYDCPKSWLEKVTPISKYGEEWLEKAKAYHSNRQQIGKGLKFQYFGTLYEVEEYHGGSMWIVVDHTSGTRTRYKMRSSNICEALIL
jgi:hypothetical protein